MFRVSICYDHPTDPQAFDEHYAIEHVPLVRTLPGLVDFTTNRCQSLVPGRTARYYMVAHLTFGTAADLTTALTSLEMASATADLENFATRGVTTYWAEDIVQSLPVCDAENQTPGREMDPTCP